MCASDGIIFPGFDYKYENNDPRDYIILPSVKEQQGKITASCLKTLVVFVGGAMDASFQPLLKFVFDPYVRRNGRDIKDNTGKVTAQRKQDVAYSEHGGGKVPPLMKEWHAAGQKIVLVGHSWGGDRVLLLAQENPDIPIELLVTLDPVSKKGKSPKPSHVKHWDNIYIDYSIADGSSANFIARTGGPWESCPGADYNQAINALPNMRDRGHADADVMFEEEKSKVEKI
ncbi:MULTISPECIES: alpha/beta hydrolase [unclassified Serratia (in: enterobacteria)]|uniref:alpha/beta hydrolase n=1 Tax=unclassified Serratia (in: enterobacteria) TaxID=2647522 RepID=UPI000468212F|nr:MULTISPECIES: alpha/beta hydrolase [unclassified Serratia (in: enterobacteria)]